MAFTRQHYVRIADILRAEVALTDATPSYAADGPQIVQNIMGTLADMFAQDNPNFDRDKFYAAAGRK